MAAIPIIRSDFYVYALFRENGITPFYIGMGIRDRWLQHERCYEAKRTHKNNIIRKILANGVTVPKVKLLENLTRIEAAQIEQDLIRLLGRYPNGPLANKTDGGEGLWNPDEETRAKMREARKHYVCSPQTRAKLSIAGTGRKMPPASAEWRTKQRAAHMGKKHSASTKEKMSKNRKGRLTYTHQVEVLSRVRKPYTTEVKERLRQARLGRRHTSDAKERVGAAAKLRWNNPDFREKIRSAQRAGHARRRARLALADAP